MTPISADVEIETTPVSNVILPHQLSARAVDCRGLSIPGMVAVIDTTPEFTALIPTSFVNYDHLDWNAWASCVNQGRCGYCRHPNEYYIFFVGHHTEVFSKRFMNPGMHYECAHYFLQVYPTVFFPRMRSGPISSGGELPMRLGVYKTREYKILKADNYGDFKNPKPNYIVRAGTQVGHTLWVDYPRHLMVQYGRREQKLRDLTNTYADLGKSIPPSAVFEVYALEGEAYVN